MCVIPGGEGEGGDCCSAEGESQRDEFGLNEGAIRAIEGGPMRVSAPESSFMAAGRVGQGATP